MAKIALLIGVSEYQAGFTPLPKASQDLEAMQRALQDHQTDGFDQIKVLRDPDLQTMRVEIEALFTGCSREDLVLLFFSGHGIKDDQGRLYFATRDTRKAANGELRRATAMESGFVQEMMNNSRCKRQVVILDCCFSGAFAAGMGAKDSGTVDIAAQLGGEGRAVLTSSTSTQYSFEEQSADLSIYTRYIVEGLETGAADLNHDGWIEVEELHDYARSKVQETAPAMKPEIYAVKEGYKIRLTRARIGDPKLRYRQEADRYASRGEISAIGRILLDTLRDRLGLSAEEAAQIEADLLRPYREHLDNLRRYREAVMAAAEVEYPFSDQTHSDLQHFQDVLGLRDEDVAPITAEIAAQVTQKAAQQHQQHLVEYQQVFSAAVEQEFPLREATWNELQQLQQRLQLSEAELTSIEQSILAQKEAEKLKQQAEAERQQQAAIEQQRQQQEAKQRQQQQEAEELRRQAEAEQRQQLEAEQQQQQQETDYQQKLLSYEQDFIRLTQSGLSNEYVRDRLRQIQQELGLRDADIAEIEARVITQQGTNKPLQQQGRDEWEEGAEESPAGKPVQQRPAGDRPARFCPPGGKPSWLIPTVAILGVVLLGLVLPSLIREWHQEAEKPLVQLDKPLLESPNLAASPATAAILTNEAAKQILDSWLSTKAKAMGPNHEIALLDQILLDPKLAEWKSAAEQAKRDNWYRTYRYDVKADSVELISSTTGQVISSPAANPEQVESPTAETSATSPNAAQSSSPSPTGAIASPTPTNPTSEADQARVVATVTETTETFRDGKSDGTPQTENLRVQYTLIRKDGKWFIQDWQVL